MTIAAPRPRHKGPRTARCLHRAVLAGAVLGVAAALSAIVALARQLVSPIETVIIAALWTPAAVSSIVWASQAATRMHFRRVAAGCRCYRLPRPRRR
ncbi:hypothetical protein ABT299_11710 [Spirillospora sp. NPDC000708]